MPPEARPDDTAGRHAVLFRSSTDTLLVETLLWVRLSSIVEVYSSSYAKSPDTGLHSRVAFCPLIPSHRCIFGRHSERNARMKRSSYGEPDYVFGQAMLTLRTTIGLTQAGVAEHLGVSRKAVGEWEAGLNYPQVAHLKAFIALAVEKQAFTAGREEEEIRALWQAARRKVSLDEAWLAALLSRAEIPPVSQ